MSEALLSFVINATWQAALIAGLGLTLARFLRLPGRQFQLLTLTLVAAVAAPALTLMPSRVAPPAAATVDLAPLRTRGGDDAIVLLYLAGLLFVAVRLMIAALRARRIAAASLPLRGRLYLLDGIDVPITIGGRVLLPRFVAGDRRLRAAALAHEHAHLRRNDYVIHVALELVSLPLYFHPMVFLLRRALAESREKACDDAAAERCGRREYAATLVRLAELAGRRRMALGLSVAATPVERRVIALLRPKARPSRASMALLFVPILVAAACTRYNVAQHATLCGRWLLIHEASDYRATGGPERYDRFEQTIEQGPTRVAVRQQRTIGGRTRVITWAVVTDGVRRPVPGIRNTVGTAQWAEGKLHLQMIGPGPHRESATAFIRDDRLVVDGRTERGTYHTEFRRIDP